MENYRVMQRKAFHFDTYRRSSGNMNNPTFAFRKDVFQVADPTISLRFSVIQATVPYTWYNIADGVGYSNNWLDLNDDGVITRITIPKGNYTIQQILASLKTMLNNVSTKGFSYSFDTTTLKATWTYTGTGSVSFIFSPDGSQSLDIVLGFLATTSSYTFPFVSKTLTSVYPVNVSQTSDVFVNITNLQGIGYEYLNNAFSVSPLFCVLPIVNVPFYSNITYQSRKDHEYEFIISSQSMPDALQFQITNQYGELLDLNRDWNITLCCEWITTIPKPSSEYHLLEKLNLSAFKIAEDLEVLKGKTKTVASDIATG